MVGPSDTAAERPQRLTARAAVHNMDPKTSVFSENDEVGILSSEERGDDSRIVVKKYANRRLYNTATSSYVTLDHLARLTQEGVDFVVYDAKSGEDITRSVLTQIIVEEEAKGENLLPIAFLRQLITFYGDNMRWMVPQYLEHMIQNFAENQDRMRGAMQDAMGNLFPFSNLEDMRKQNMAFFEQAMRVWSPFAAGQAAVPPAQPPAKPPAVPPRPPAYAAVPPKPAPSQAELDRLQAEVKSLKAKLADADKPPAAANSQPPAAAESKPLPPAASAPKAAPPVAAPPTAAPPAAEAPVPAAPAPEPAPAAPKAEAAASPAPASPAPASPAPAEPAAKPAPKAAPKAAPARAAKATPARAAKAAPARAPAAKRSTTATRRAPKPAVSKSDDTKKN